MINIENASSTLCGFIGNSPEVSVFTVIKTDKEIRTKAIAIETFITFMGHKVYGLLYSIYGELYFYPVTA